MPIEKIEATRLCKRYLASLPEYSDRERIEIIRDSLAEICETTYQAQATLVRWRALNRALPTYADLLEIAEQTPVTELQRVKCGRCRGTGWLIVDVLVTMEPRPEGREFRSVERITEQEAGRLQFDDDFRRIQATGKQMLNTGAERCPCGAGLVARHG